MASFSRQPLSQWQGVLIAYDVMEWFLGLQVMQTGNEQHPPRHPHGNHHPFARLRVLQYHGLIHEDVEWPDDDILATAMLEYKQTKAGQQVTDSGLGQGERSTSHHHHPHSDVTRHPRAPIPAMPRARSWRSLPNGQMTPWATSLTLMRASKWASSMISSPTRPF